MRQWCRFLRPTSSSAAELGSVPAAFVRVAAVLRAGPPVAAVLLPCRPCAGGLRHYGEPPDPVADHGAWKDPHRSSSDLRVLCLVLTLGRLVQSPFHSASTSSW